MQSAARRMSFRLVVSNPSVSTESRLTADRHAEVLRLAALIDQLSPWHRKMVLHVVRRVLEQQQPAAAL